MHCIIVKTDGLLLLRDLGSTNGTRVNGTRVRRAALLPNDQVSIAHFKFRVYLGPDLPPPVSPNERTQQIDQRLTLERVLGRGTHLDDDSAEDLPALDVHTKRCRTSTRTTREELIIHHKDTKSTKERYQGRKIWSPV